MFLRRERLPLELEVAGVLASSGTNCPLQLPHQANSMF